MSNIKLLETEVADAFFSGFKALRPIQEASIEPIITGKNVVACSGTDSGKTEAAMAPIISRYWDEFEKTDSTLIIYVAPTKSLINDLARRFEQPMAKLDLRFGVRHGDRDDIRRRKNLPHLVITTPESLDVMLFRDDKSLKSVRAVIIDEIHLFYNTQRGLQLSILLERLRRFIRADRLQLAALSATIENLEKVGRFFFGDKDELHILEFPAHRSLIVQIRPGDYVHIVDKLTKSQNRKLLTFTNSRKHCEQLSEEILQNLGFREPYSPITHRFPRRKGKRSNKNSKNYPWRYAMPQAPWNWE